MSLGKPSCHDEPGHPPHSLFVERNVEAGYRFTVGGRLDAGGPFKFLLESPHPSLVVVKASLVIHRHPLTQCIDDSDDLLSVEFHGPPQRAIGARLKTDEAVQCCGLDQILPSEEDARRVGRAEVLAPVADEVGAHRCVLAQLLYGVHLARRVHDHRYPMPLADLNYVLQG